MSCQARILGAEYPLEGDTFHTTTFCGKFAQKRIQIGDDTRSCCNDCFRRYTSQKEWYGWMDCAYPPDARVVGSQAFFRAHGKPVAVAKLPAQKCPLGGCATCWRMSFERTTCQTCAIELCRACASVALTGDKGDFCKRCVPKPKKEELEVEISEQFAQLSLSSAAPGAGAGVTGEPKVKAAPKPKVTLDYPIRTDIAKLSAEELRALHSPLVAWMKEYQNKFPRLLVP